MKYTIYILRDNIFQDIDVFTDRNSHHYVQYKKNGEEKLSIKHGTLDELVGEYEYGELTKKVELFEREIEIA